MWPVSRLFLANFSFLPRCVECRCSLVMRILSVCPSNTWIVTKRKNSLFRFLFHAKDHLVWFSEKRNGWLGGAWCRELDSQRSLFQTKYAEYWRSAIQNPDMTPEHCGRGSTACYRHLQRPPLPFTRQMTLSLISGGKSRTFGRCVDCYSTWHSVPTYQQSL